ncbi:MAG: RNA-guided endonuclease InsQ/TnpB family protein [Nitrosotalea sp.]
MWRLEGVRNYKFRLYPNSVIKARLGATLEASRWLYNYLLSKNLRSKQDMQFALTELKETETWLKLYHSKMLQMIPHRIDSARRSLIEKKKRGYVVGQLQYAIRDEWNTFVYNQSGFSIEKHGNADLLWLSKIGWMEIRLHRPLDGNIKQITITKKTGKWYAIITVEMQPVLPKLIDIKKSVGIDVGIKNYTYDSDGNVTPNPQNLEKMLKPLVRAQRKMSRRVKGSNNYKKAKRWYQIVHERIANRRRDFQHKLSTYYARNYDVVFMEKLHLQNMVKNHNLARRIMDAGWGSFKNMVEYKCMEIDVKSRNSTIDCSRCGHKVPKVLAIRIHHCDQCSLFIDRDHNASLNILKRGLALWNLPMEHREVTPV